MESREDSVMRWWQSLGPGEGMPYALLLRYAVTWSTVMAASSFQEKEVLVVYCTPLMKDISLMRHLVYALAVYRMSIFYGVIKVITTLFVSVRLQALKSCIQLCKSRLL